MSLTIHYSFELGDNDFAVARDRVEKMRRRALELPFERVGDIQHYVGDECLENGDRLRFFGKLHSNDAQCPLVTPDEIIGFSALPGEGCESAEFGLRRVGACIGWQAFCKTDFAAGSHIDFLRCHLTVIAMLDHAQELGILRRVDDKSGYWERRDWGDLLVRNRDGNVTRNRLVAVSEKLFRWFGPLREKAAFVMQEE